MASLQIEPLNEFAIILRDIGESPISAARKLKDRLPGLLDSVPCYDTLALFFEQKIPDLSEILEGLNATSESAPSRHHRIPVCYELGIDLAEVAQLLKMDAREFVEIHSLKRYDCVAVGFQPGFGYLGDLDEKIAHVPRLPSPRVRVEAGSVAISGKQTAVYPSWSPGGWRIVGLTPTRIVDLNEDFFLLAAGDTVEFFAIDLYEYEKLKEIGTA